MDRPEKRSALITVSRTSLGGDPETDSFFCEVNLDLVHQCVNLAQFMLPTLLKALPYIHYKPFTKRKVVIWFSYTFLTLNQKVPV